LAFDRGEIMPKYTPILLVPLLLALVGCPKTQLPPSTQGGGFSLGTFFAPLDGPVVPAPNTNFTDNWVSDDSGAMGSATPINATTAGNAFIALPGKRAPATWKWKWITPGPVAQCSGVTAQGDVSLGAMEEFWCVERVVTTVPLIASPTPIDLASLPSTVSISNAPSGSFVSTYGMPQTQYIDPSGTIDAVANANSISGGGTTISGPTPAISVVAIGYYVGVAGNITSSGHFGLVGAGSILLQNTIGLTGSFTSGSVVFYGKNFTSTYGRPWLQFTATNPGNSHEYQAQAYNCQSQSGGITACWVNMGSMSSGSYDVLVLNVNSDNSLTAVGDPATSF
jgi:hypothetical protein